MIIKGRNQSHHVTLFARLGMARDEAALEHSLDPSNFDARHGKGFTRL